MDIRYRVWDGEKMWYPEDGRVFFMIDAVGSVYEAGECIPLAHTTAMLSMGFKDQNDKEIFDSDIVTDGVWIHEVQWEQLAGNACGFWISKESSAIRILGNKYENPELLKHRGIYHDIWRISQTT